MGFQKTGLDQFPLFLFPFSLELSPKRELERASKQRGKKPPPPRPRCPAPTAPPFPCTPLAMMHRCQLTSQIVRAQARGLHVACRGEVKIVDEQRKKLERRWSEFFPPFVVVDACAADRFRLREAALWPQPTRSVPFSGPTGARKHTRSELRGSFSDPGWYSSEPRGECINACKLKTKKTKSEERGKREREVKKSKTSFLLAEAITWFISP